MSSRDESPIRSVVYSIKIRQYEKSEKELESLLSNSNTQRALLIDIDFEDHALSRHFLIYPKDFAALGITEKTHSVLALWAKRLVCGAGSIHPGETPTPPELKEEEERLTGPLVQDSDWDDYLLNETITELPAATRYHLSAFC
jgi:hypothetical protein